MKQTVFCKPLALLLTLCLLLTAVPAIGAAAELSPVTDENGVIHISTPEELAAIGVDSNFPRDGSYVLDQDIDLSVYENWTPLCGYYSSATQPLIYKKEVAFSGTLDGQGHTISGMTVNYENTADAYYDVMAVGLFSCATTDADIKNIVFRDCSVRAVVGVTVYAGIVVGMVNDGSYAKISNVAVLDSSVHGNSSNPSNLSGIGAIAGQGTKLSLTNVYADARLSGGCLKEGNEQFGIGGMVGAAWRGYLTADGAVFNGTIENSTAGAACLYGNGIFALNTTFSSTFPTASANFKNCYYNSDKLTVSTAGNGGQIDGTPLTAAELETAKLSALGLSGEYWSVAQGAPTLRITFPKTVPYHDGYIPIYDAYDLAKIGKDAGYPLSGSYFVMNDIDLSDYGSWTPIANTTNNSLNTITDAAFTGVFDGGGHTISNLTVSGTGSRFYGGLFCIAYDAEFCNLVIRNAEITSAVGTKGYAGALLAVSRSSTSSLYSTTVSNVAVYDSSVTVTNTNTGDQTGAGGLVGMSESGVLITDCYVEADVTAAYVGAAGESKQVAAGGLIGMAYQGKITAEDCVFAGTLQAAPCSEGYEGTPTAAYVRQNSVMGSNNAGFNNTANDKPHNAKATDTYYLDTVTVNPKNPRGLDGTPISAEALAAASPESLGLSALYWLNDGTGLSLAVAPAAFNADGKIEIASAGQLALIGVSSLYPRVADYVLTADLDLSSYENWSPLCAKAGSPFTYDKDNAFIGTLDGRGHTVSGMNITASGTSVTAGLFSGAGTGAQIRNLVFENCSVDVTASKELDAGIVVGCIVADASGFAVVSNIAIRDSSVNGVQTAALSRCGVGSVAGQGTCLTLENIVSEAALSGGCQAAFNEFGIGGMVGRAWRGYVTAGSVIFNGTIQNITPADNGDAATVLYANGILGMNWYQGSYPTNPANFVNCYYNSDKLTVSATGNGGEINGTAMSAYQLGISTVGVLSLDSAGWLHNGYYPTLKITGDSAYTPGDTNRDGACDIRDIVRVKRYLAKTEENICLVAADLKRDSDITADDLSYLRKTLLGVSNATTVELASAAEQVKYLGRSASENGILLMDWSNTGYELSAMAEGDVTATFTYVPATEGRYPYARIAVTVDGDTAGAQILHITEGTAVYTLAQGLDYGPHTIRVVKLSERTKGRIYARDVMLVGALNERPADAALTIDFYGDSITAGDGVVKNARTTDEDYIECQYADKTYAAKTGELLGADIRVAANSGLKTVNAVSKLLEAGTWDYASNQADVVVINLGTNDKSVVYEDGTAATDAGIAAEKAAVTDMLTAVREKYPQAKIVWVYGMMGTDLSAYIREAVEEYAAADAGVFYCELPKNTAGGGNHPDEAGHTAAAAVLAEYISTTVLGE